MFDLIKRKVNEWNPTGVDDLPADEYDCLAEKIDSWLASDIGRDEMSAFIEEELRDHFQIDMEEIDIEDFIEELLEALQSAFKPINEIFDDIDD